MFLDEDPEDYHCVGYRIGEVDTPDPVEINPAVRLKVSEGAFNRPRTPLGRSLGPIVKGVAVPMADALDSNTLRAGALYRFCRKHNEHSSEDLESLREFVRRFIRRNLEPVEAGSVTFHEYIEQTHYSRKRKDDLTRVWQELGGRAPRRTVYRSFGKVETLRNPGVFKHVRCINPPPDEWKVYASPYIHRVEKLVCSLPWFAKYIPVYARPAFVHDLFEGRRGPFWVTDYTSFESSFSPDILVAIEGELYTYMLQNYPEVARTIVDQISGVHQCKFRGFEITVPGIRMSGDPNTSLGNGFSNLMLTAWMCERSGIEFEGIVEGDDGLFCFSGQPRFSDIAALGFELKLEPHDTIYTTSFCGLMLSRSLACFADPRYVIAAFGWSHSTLRNSGRRNRRGLLRSKALSLLYSHPRCPLLTVLAERFIYLTSGFDTIDENNYWNRRILDERVKYSKELEAERSKGITIDDRVDFEDLYGISVDDQFTIEDELSQATFAPIDSPAVLALYEDCPTYLEFGEKFCGSAASLVD